MKKKTITAVDMYCGAGGTDEGLRQACDRHGVVLKLIAVNHWEIAIATHSANHSYADHLCADLNSVDPRKVVPNGKLDLLIASPECTHHSNARGGKPINDQSRASAWRVVEWLSQIQVENALIENVPEFRGWGPLIEKKVEKEMTLPSPQMKFERWYAKTRRNGGTLEEWKRIYRDLQGAETSGKVKRRVKITVQIPDPKRKGEIYISFLKAIESHGYTVDTRIINAADYGDPTSRERLFIRARRGNKPIRWPEPTHAPSPKAKANSSGNGHRTLFDMTPARPSYRTAREIIDWDIPGQSIFTRKRPLTPNTMAKIWAGLEKVCGLSVLGSEQGKVQPFLVKYYGGHDVQLLDEPLPAITASYEHYGLARPYIVELRNGQDVRSIDEPLSTITTKGMHHAICRPYIIVLRNNVSPRSIDEPLATVAAGGSHHALCQPFVLVNRNNNTPKSFDEPVPALCTGNHMYLVKPYIIPVNHGKDRRPRSVDEPMPTITTFVFSVNRSSRLTTIRIPVPVASNKTLLSVFRPGFHLESVTAKVTRGRQPSLLASLAEARRESRTWR
ncbi:MAG: DNA cytosine methyltransferase [Blastocatellia bacterium]